MAHVLIITPCHNHGHVVHETIRSAIGQTYPHWRMVIVDDGSEWEDSRRLHRAVCALDDPRVIECYPWRPGEALGSAWARNLAALHGGPSDWIVPLDADDMLVPTHLERMLAGVGDADWAYCDLELFGDQVGVIRAPDDAQATVREVNRFTHGGSLLSREMFDALGGYRLSLRFSEDWDLFVRADGAGFRSVHVPEVLYRYRRHQGSKMRTGPTLEERAKAVLG